MNDTYRTIDKEYTGYFKDKGSKFLSYAYPVKHEDDVKPIIQQLKKEHHSARHHCYAWRIGTTNIKTRANDDGEPSSTAGKPILGQLVSYGITNILVVVVRYFGGTLLGVSGLINAYKMATIDVLENAEIVEKIIEKSYRLCFEYPLLNTVMHHIKTLGVNILNTNFTESCELDFSVRLTDEKKVTEIFNELYGVQLKNLE